LALLIATIGAVLALLTGHARWIELAWLSIAASLLALVVSKLWPIVIDREGSKHQTWKKAGLYRVGARSRPVDQAVRQNREAAAEKRRL